MLLPFFKTLSLTLTYFFLNWSFNIRNHWQPMTTGAIRNNIYLQYTYILTDLRMPTYLTHLHYYIHIIQNDWFKLKLKFYNKMMARKYRTMAGNFTLDTLGTNITSDTQQTTTISSVCPFIFSAETKRLLVHLAVYSENRLVSALI